MEKQIEREKERERERERERGACSLPGGEVCDKNVADATRVKLLDILQHQEHE